MALEWLTEEGLRNLENGYLYQDEQPLDMYHRVTDAAARRLNRPDLAPVFFEAIMKNWLCCATPVLTNMGMPKKGLPISCFGLTVPDSVEGIGESITEFMLMSKNGGGVGINMSHVRGRGSPITDNGVSDGIVPFIKQFDTAVIGINQNSRRGSISANLSVHHKDLAEFLKIGKPQGDVDRQCLRTNTCVQITDEFMQDVMADRGSARETYLEVLRSRLETGEPYIQYIDTVNRANPEGYKRLGLEVDMTNICSEIMLFSDEEHSFVCCLSSLNLARWEEWKDYRFSNGMTLPELGTWFLDGVMSEFIAKASSMPYFERSVRFAEKSRALGLGVLGWHTLLQQLDLPFDTSVDVMGLNHRIFKFLNQETRKASQDLAVAYGEPDWCRGTGYRNTHRIALAPTMSNSVISGNLSASIEPIPANAYMFKSAHGSFERRNPAFAAVLDLLGKNKPDVWSSIVKNDGSVQHLDFLSEHQKYVFLTAREMNQLGLIEQAAQRQGDIDQGQSLNLFFPSNVESEWVTKLHVLAWEKGIKTLYYVRSSSPLKGDMATRAFDADCVACEG